MALNPEVAPPLRFLTTDNARRTNPSARSMTTVSLGS